MINIYIDGSSRKHGDEGGYGVVAIENNKILYNTSFQAVTVTNNQMELGALIKALQYAKDMPISDYTIYCDSAYVVNMFNIWIDHWHDAGWKKYDKKEIKNLDLVKEIYELKYHAFRSPNVVKVAGHEGIVGNELADALATDNLIRFQKIVEVNNLEIV